MNCTRAGCSLLSYPTTNSASGYTVVGGSNEVVGDKGSQITYYKKFVSESKRKKRAIKGGKSKQKLSIRKVKPERKTSAAKSKKSKEKSSGSKSKKKIVRQQKSKKSKK